MIIDYLGHSEFLVKIQNASGKEVRILCDTWLSPYVVGDLMGRNPIFTINYTALWYIDLIYISHSHSDHLDPYTLIDIYKNLEQAPILVLPETLSFLTSLFEKYIDGIQIHILKNKDVFLYEWIKLRGFIFNNTEITNEDDVMSLFISNDEEILYTEVDCVPPDTPETRNYIYRIFTEKRYQNILYLATRNELEGNLQLLDMSSTDERKKLCRDYEESRKESIEYEYAKFSENIVEYRDVTKIPWFLRVYIGQWICFPIQIDPSYLQVRVMPLEHNVQWDTYYSRQYGKKFFIGFFEAWKSYKVQNAKAIFVWDIWYLQNFIFENPKIDISASISRKYLQGPLSSQLSNFTEQEKILLSLLNTRFLPYWIWNAADPLKNAMTKNGRYVIKVLFWNAESFEARFYVLDFARFVFERSQKDFSDYDEKYWMNDVFDFYNWEQELYSNFHHALEKWKAYRFWTALGANFLNNDLVYKKFELHFKRAILGHTTEEFVLPVYTKLLWEK